MAIEKRLEAILIRFDCKGNIKGACAYDYEQFRNDDGSIMPLRELPARGIEPSDVDGLLTGDTLDLVAKNAGLLKANTLLKEQRDAEMSGRAVDAESFRSNMDDAQKEIKSLQGALKATARS